MKTIRTIGILALFLFAAETAMAANYYYVRAGATGGNNGSDWTNAYTSLPSTLSRGDTYYVAGGSYPSRTFSDPVSGTLTITIKKATDADHGTDTGWSSAYAGQAVWTAPLRFSTGYYVFNGSYRTESNWFDGTAYGFKIANASGDTNPTVYLYGSYTTISYTAMVNTVQGSAATRSYVIDYEGPSVNYGSVVSHCLTQYGSNHYFLRQADGCVVEYCAATGAESNANNHGEIVNLYGMYGRSNNIHVRYNIFKDNFVSGLGTAVIANAGDTGNMIYGNVFYNNGTTDGSIGWNGTVADHAVHNLLVYNNTFVNGRGYASGIMLDTLSTGCYAYNNLWVGGNSAGFQAVTHDYNAFSGSSNFSEAHAQVSVPTSIFVNYNGGDFRLSGATAAGTSLSSPFNYDPLGNLRGADGVWDRGAYEFGGVAGTGGGAAPKPSPPQSLTVQ